MEPEILNEGEQVNVPIEAEVVEPADEANEEAPVEEPIE